MRNYFSDWTLFEKMLIIIASSIIIGASIVLRNPADSLVWVITGVVSALCGVICVVLCAKGKISNYYFGVVYVASFIAIAYHNKLFGQAMVNLVYYLPMNIIGYFMWKKAGATVEDSINTVSMTTRQIVITVAGTLVAAVAYGAILQRLEGNFVFMDALVTILSIIAMYLQNKRYTETWGAWFIYNVAACSLWIIAVSSGNANSESISMLLMNLTYLVNSVYGFLNWRRLEQNGSKEGVQ